MLKVLIVDDDFPVRMLFKQIIDWEEEGFEVVGEALDGAEAIEMVESLNPHVILLDMEMPHKNGVQVIEELMEKNFGGKIIVISCHDDFKYVKQALKLGATDYLLKTNVDDSKLKEVLHVAKQDLIKQKQDKAKVSTMKRLANKGLHTLKQEYLRNLLGDVNIINNDFQSKVNQLQLRLSLTKNMMLAIEIDKYMKQLLKVGSSKDHALFRFTIRNIIEEVMGDRLQGELVAMEQRFYLIINTESWVSESNMRRDILNMVHQIRECLKKYLDVTTTMIIMDKLITMADVHRTYLEAEQALMVKFYKGGNTVYVKSQLSPANKDMPKWDKSKESELKDYIANKNEMGLLNFFRREFSRIKKDYVNPIYVHEYLEVIYELLVDACKRDGIILGNYLEVINDYKGTMVRYETLEDIEKMTYDMVERVFIDLNKELVSENTTVQSVVQYISQHFTEDISLGSVCEHIHMNMTYVSHLFKQEVGISFTEYLKNSRIEQAMKLIESTDLRINEVADQVGIHNKKYFARLFKDKVGVTPSQYRKQKNLY